MNMELFKEIAAKCNGPLIDGCLIEIETLRQQLAEKDAEIGRLETVPMKYRRMEFNAQLQCENNDLREQLAASQAREVQLREAFTVYWERGLVKEFYDAVGVALESLRGDTTALEVMIAEAGEVMRVRTIQVTESHQVPVGNSAAGEMACEWTYEALNEIREATRALPGVTIEDLQ